MVLMQACKEQRWESKELYEESAFVATVLGGPDVFKESYTDGY